MFLQFLLKLFGYVRKYVYLCSRLCACPFTYEHYERMSPTKTFKRMQINTENDDMMIQQEFEALLDDYSKTQHRQKVELITRAFEFAKQAHAGIRRRSGEPYIMHPLAVARIVVKEIGLGSTSICAALLHDVVEDTDYTVEDIEERFGPKIASIVDGLTKISGGVFGQQASLQAENFRKLLLTMSEDVRVVLIKIADRLHNMRTLQAQPMEKQYKIAGETQYIYAPLAHRLGLFPIKSELEDLSFKYEHPDTYQQLQEKLQKVTDSYLQLFDQFAQPIRDKLEMMGYNFELQARIKSVYSIWKKMTAKHVPFEEVYDLLAVRIIFDPKFDMSEKDQCWMLYSALTEMYKPHPERIRDWISTPKANGYEALHVTVMGQEGQWIEVQIRTRRMHEIAERGLAAHWKYKTGFGSEDETELDKWIRTIRETLQNPSPNAIDFLDTFKLNLFAEEVFVFTPQGDIKTLPQNATVLDFAYLLHSELGDHCIGAKVNHKLQPASYQLRGGDQVEVLTSQTQHPALQWLDWAITAKAQDRVKKYLRKQGMLSELFIEATSEEVKPAEKSKVKNIILTDDNVNVLYKLEPCCHPIPGDEVLGYRDPQGHIHIHKVDCPEAAKAKTQHGKNLVSATWDTAGANEYLQTIRMEGIDKVGLIIRVLYTITESYHINITDMHFKAVDGIFSGTVEMQVHGVNEVNNIFNDLKRIPEIKLVTRV